MNKTSFIALVCGLGLSLVCTQGFAAHCAVEIEMAAHLKTIDLQLEPAELPAGSLMLLPNGRVAAGTFISPGDDTIVTGGRFVVSNIESGQVETALETPTLDGRPTFMSEVARSNDGNYVLATGGYMFGGPALLYEADPSFRYLDAHQVTRNPMRSLNENLFNLVVRGADGDRQAQAQLDSYWPGSAHELTTALAEDPEMVRNVLTELTKGLALPNAEERVPVINVQFHPDGSKFLLNSGDSVSIRNSRGGRILHDISLNDLGIPNSMSPPRTFFMGGGEQILAFSRQMLSLWDVQSGQPLDARAHAGEPVEASRSLEYSPNAEYFSYVVVENKQTTRQVWTVGRAQSGQQAGQLKLAASYRLNGNNVEPERAPSIAFSGKGVYAVGQSGGLIELHDMKTHALLDQGEIQIGSPEERAELKVPRLAMDHSGKWLVALGHSSRGFFLELWSVENRKGVRMRVPPATVEGREPFLSDVEFDPKGEWFSFIVNETEELSSRAGGSRSPGAKQVHSTPYVVDVYTAMANAVQKP